MQHIMMGEFDPSKVAGHEDCLYVNVFTPTLDPNANLNVIVNIHGGGFTGGSSNYITESFLMLRKDFVLVTLHYRVGILGNALLSNLKLLQYKRIFLFTKLM